jgi:hypothetical protein
LGLSRWKTVYEGIAIKGARNNSESFRSNFKPMQLSSLILSLSFFFMVVAGFFGIDRASENDKLSKNNINFVK